MRVFPVREGVRKRWRGRRGEVQRRKKRGVKEGELLKGRGGGKEGQREGIIRSMVVQSNQRNECIKAGSHSYNTMVRE